MKESLEVVVTINLWEHNFWRLRKPVLISELRNHHITSDRGVMIMLQEVRRFPFNTISEVAHALGFTKDSVYFFPTRINGNYGLGIITNLKVVRKDFMFFTHDNTDPLEFGERGVGLIEVQDALGVFSVGVVHLSVSEKMQGIHAQETIQALKNFSTSQRALISGDFNADPLTPTYHLFQSAGYTDFTKPLRTHHTFTWPSDPEWVVSLHQKTFGKPPPYDVHKLQRWMDYIWGSGFSPEKTELLGTKPMHKMYASDHLFPAVWFES